MTKKTDKEVVYEVIVRDPETGQDVAIMEVSRKVIVGFLMQVLEEGYSDSITVKSAEVITSKKA